MPNDGDHTLMGMGMTVPLLQDHLTVAIAEAPEVAAHPVAVRALCLVIGQGLHLPVDERRLLGAVRLQDALHRAGRLGVLRHHEIRVHGICLRRIADDVEEQRHVVVVLVMARLAAAEAGPGAEVGLPPAVADCRGAEALLCAPPIEEEELVLRPPVAPKQHIRHVAAVVDPVLEQGQARQLAQCREHVHAADDLARPPLGLNLSLPIRKGGRPDAALPRRALPDVPVPGVAARQDPRASSAPSLRHPRAVVSRKEDERVLLDARVLDGPVDVADEPIGLHDGVAKVAQSRSVPELAARILRVFLVLQVIHPQEDGVHVAEGHVEEEGLVLVRVYVVDRERVVPHRQVGQVQGLLHDLKLAVLLLLDQREEHAGYILVGCLLLDLVEEARLEVVLPAPRGAGHRRRLDRRVLALTAQAGPAHAAAQA
mmetsp:Transcript_137893/g.428516  ORF Transcript_137893/g.428516 Transcript_137893/m.428516 type:complete len:427 (-) Transcript_137893:510-1790(-)